MQWLVVKRESGGEWLAQQPSSKRHRLRRNRSREKMRNKLLRGYAAAHLNNVINRRRYINSHVSAFEVLEAGNNWREVAIKAKSALSRRRDYIGVSVSKQASRSANRRKRNLPLLNMKAKYVSPAAVSAKRIGTRAIIRRA